MRAAMRAPADAHFLVAHVVTSASFKRRCSVRTEVPVALASCSMLLSPLSSTRAIRGTQAYQNLQQRKAELPRWLHRYNWHRLHAGIADKVPISRLGLSEDNLLRLHT
jgi:transposase InsO family protein